MSKCEMTVEYSGEKKQPCNQEAKTGQKYCVDCLRGINRISPPKPIQFGDNT